MKKLVKKKSRKAVKKKPTQKIYKHRENSGHPRKFKTAEALQKKVDAYFKKPTNNRTVVFEGEVVEIPTLTVCGFAYHLGFMDRQSIYDYIKLNDKYSCIIKRAKFFIESQYEALLQSNNVAGVIFALKNMGWKDRYVVDDAMGDHLFDKLQNKTDAELDQMYKEL